MDCSAGEAFYRRVLELEAADDPAPLVTRALELLTRLCAAQLGHVELFAHDGETPYRTSCGDAQRVSPEIIRVATVQRATLSITSAYNHPRFRHCPAVLAHAPRAVVCAPIGLAAAVGVVYIEGRDAPGPFSDLDRERIEVFARRLAVVAARIQLARPHAHTLDDEVRWLEHRVAHASLQRHGGNVSSAARALGITRTRLYRILRRRAA